MFHLVADMSRCRKLALLQSLQPFPPAVSFPAFTGLDKSLLIHLGIIPHNLTAYTLFVLVNQILRHSAELLPSLLCWQNTTFAFIVYVYCLVVMLLHVLYHYVYCSSRQIKHKGVENCLSFSVLALHKTPPLYRALLRVPRVLWHLINPETRRMLCPFKKKHITIARNIQWDSPHSFWITVTVTWCCFPVFSQRRDIGIFTGQSISSISAHGDKLVLLTQEAYVW